MTPFELPGGGWALFTTREHGNFSTMRGDGYERGGELRTRLRESLGLERLCIGRQVHGATVRRVHAAEIDLHSAGGGGPGVAATAGSHVVAAAAGDEHASVVAEEGQATAAAAADGQATTLRGVGTMVLAADCLPVVLGSSGAVAVLHAGWRGLAAGVLEEGVRALRELGGGEQIAAIIGPGAGACCYEVGEQVHAALGGGHRHGRRLDLAAHAGDRLAAAGVGPIERVEVCTICDERYFSHRREGQRAGRQAGVAWLA
jgi:YfiH family protein